MTQIWYISYRGSYQLQWRHNGRDSVSNHQPHDCLLNRLFSCRSKETLKLRITGLCAGNSPGTCEFPAPMASNAENVFIWWRHHAWFTSDTWFNFPSRWGWVLTDVDFAMGGRLEILTYRSNMWTFVTTDKIVLQLEMIMLYIFILRSCIHPTLIALSRRLLCMYLVSTCDLYAVYIEKYNSCEGLNE